MLNDRSNATLRYASQLAYTDRDLASLTRLRCPCEWRTYCRLGGPVRALFRFEPLET
jgi:hypothetical protein